jgi:hypothetical protein
MVFEQRGTWLAVGAFAAFAILCVTAFQHGRSVAAEAARLEAVTAETESQKFCDELGLKTGTDLYARCTRGLDDVRHRQWERWQRQAADSI